MVVDHKYQRLIYILKAMVYLAVAARNSIRKSLLGERSDGTLNRALHK